MKTVEEITRRLLGRNLITINNVTGIPGQSPTIIMIWSGGMHNSIYYDSHSEYSQAVAEARAVAWSWRKTHDVCDNTL